MQNVNWIRRVKLQQLRAVLALADSPSLVQASEALNLSQPAVSKILRELETDLGVELFTRTSRGSHTTPMGDMLVERVKVIFSQLERVAQEIHDINEGLSGHVVVGVLPAGGADFLPRALASLYRQYPGIRVTIIEGTYDSLIPQLQQGAIEMIVGRIPAYRFRDGLAVEPLYEETITFAVCPDHPLLARPDVTLKDLLDWPWIMPLPDTTLRQMVESAFHDAGLDLPQAPCESISVITNRRLIMATDYIAAFPSQVIQTDLDTGLLAAIPVNPAKSFGAVGISQVKERPLSHAALRLVEELRGVAGRYDHSSD
ncbi:LysR substrate-binding domain-containing protein [Oceanobacter sp. 3_MG-2023]|uniref:LysR substrate-binding domain-containing protein n=2 Tax=Gammaproteobacteria TaxID=1236 RepID=UPI002735CBDE|nr:LysR substrate-binding domain-containing protein [Oceanobacter sp. 3_MG-2023]MDP2507235.1 LysR substrate-binding domain-containing protein [Oceanobacter sp. 3_MG-2023]